MNINQMEINLYMNLTKIYIILLHTILNFVVLFFKINLITNPRT